MKSMTHADAKSGSRRRGAEGHAVHLTLHSTSAALQAVSATRCLRWTITECDVQRREREVSFPDPQSVRDGRDSMEMPTGESLWIGRATVKAMRLFL